MTTPAPDSPTPATGSARSIVDTAGSVADAGGPPPEPKPADATGGAPQKAGSSAVTEPRRAGSSAGTPWRRFRRNPSAMAGLVLLTVMAGTCALGLFYSLGDAPPRNPDPAAPAGTPGTGSTSKSGATTKPSDATKTGTGDADPVHAPAAEPRYRAQDLDRSFAKDPAGAAPRLPAGGFSLATPFGLDADGRPTHLLGSDDLGRDVLARLLKGGAISLMLGLLAATAASIFGTAYGMVAGWFGGWVDNFLMRAAEVLYSLPYLLLVVLTFQALEGVLGHTGLPPSARGLAAMLVAVAAFNWMTVARVVRGQVLQLREMPYVEAARALGAKAPRILVRHMLPNLLGPVVVLATLMVPQAILLESFLSFLGIGIQPPEVTWGLMAADGVKSVNTVQNPHWLIAPPCVALATTLLALNFVGDGLRDAVDPQSRR